MKDPRLHGVYLITDTAIQQRYSHVDLAECAVQAGIHLVQYRNKAASGRQALADIRAMASVCRDTRTTLMVNDRADMAVAGEADGVHVGQEDLPIPAARKVIGPDRIVGGTSSTLQEALGVERDGADYVALGHIFDTTTKQKNYPPRGLDILKEICDAVSIPVVAIGGITLGNARSVIDAGADMIALCSPICTAQDPARAAAELVALF